MGFGSPTTVALLNIVSNI